jgi:hypothetical protein
MSDGKPELQIVDTVVSPLGTRKRGRESMVKVQYRNFAGPDLMAERKKELKRIVMTVQRNKYTI